jgi:diaminopropionate ammonia-lyase
MRYFFNPYLEFAPASAPMPHGAPGQAAGGPTSDAGAVLAFHRSLAGYAPTPLHSLPGLAAEIGLGNLFVKDESRRFGLRAFKALGASWALRSVVEARRAAGEPPPATVATATDGNHGRAVAWAARRLGLAAVVFIPAHAAAARVEAIRGEGARVVLVEGTYDDAVAHCAAGAAAGGWQVISDTGYAGYLDVPRRVAEGYATLFLETDAERVARGWRAPDLVLVQGGVGALAAAAVEFAGKGRPQPLVAVVEPDSADCLLESIASPGGRPSAARGRQDSIMAGLNCGLPSLAAWPALRCGVDLFLSVEDRHAEEAVQRLWRPAAGDPRIEAGESGAAGLAGLLALCGEPALRGARDRLRLGRRTAVLLINTEGATDPEGFRRITGAAPPV